MLEELRREMDHADSELVKLLAKRMEISKRIGDAKRSEGVEIHQKTREIAVLDKAKLLGDSLGLSDAFLTDVYSTILAESRRQQGAA